MSTRRAGRPLGVAWGEPTSKTRTRQRALPVCFAPAPENDTAAHEEAHGLIPSEVIAVSEEAVLRFLGNLHEPADHTEITTSLRTIVFTDLEGSMAIADELGPTAFMEILGEHDLIVRRSLVTHRGREVKHTGDGIMASFDDVEDALARAPEIREAESRARIRVGMAAGEPVDHNNDLFGPTVTSPAGSVMPRKPAKCSSPTSWESSAAAPSASRGRTR